MDEKVFVDSFWALLQDVRKIKVMFVNFLDVIKTQIVSVSKI